MMRSNSNRFLGHRMHRGARLIAALTLLMVAGCGSSTKPKPAGSSAYTGTLAGPTISGKFSINVASDNVLSSQASYNASGTLTQTAPSAQTVNLSGKYDDTFHHAYLYGSGSGGAVWGVDAVPESYGMSTFVDSDTNNVASEAAYGSLFKTSSDVSVFLGTYTITSGPTNGIFDFSIRGAEVQGDAVLSTGAHTVLSGTYGVGAADSIRIANPSPGVVPPLAAGKLVGTTASGDYYDSSGATIGTWTTTKQP